MLLGVCCWRQACPYQQRTKLVHGLRPTPLLAFAGSHTWPPGSGSLHYRISLTNLFMVPGAHHCTGAAGSRGPSSLSLRGSCWPSWRPWGSLQSVDFGLRSHQMVGVRVLPPSLPECPGAPYANYLLFLCIQKVRGANQECQRGLEVSHLYNKGSQWSGFTEQFQGGFDDPTQRRGCNFKKIIFLKSLKKNFF